MGWDLPTDRGLEQPNSLADRLRGIAAFLPEFSTPGFVFGRQVMRSSPASDSIEAYPTLGKTACEFIRTTYDLGWVLLDFDWPRWIDGLEARMLRDNPDALAGATPNQLARLITVCVRHNRFVEGGLQSTFDSGLLTRIVARAANILVEMESGRLS